MGPMVHIQKKTIIIPMRGLYPSRHLIQPFLVPTTLKLVFYPDAHPHYAEALEMTNDEIPEQIGKLIESFQPRVNQEFNQEC